jgi:hypothetical protein
MDWDTCFTPSADACSRRCHAGDSLEMKVRRIPEKHENSTVLTIPEKIMSLLL